MDSGRIAKISFVVVMLGVVSYFVYRNWDFWSGRAVDPSLTMSGPYPRKNPNADANHKTFEYLFADSHGKLTITETDVDDQLESLTFLWETAAGSAQRTWGRTVVENTLNQSLTSISDPVRRFWLRNVLGNQRMATSASSYVVFAGLNQDQKAAEKELRKDLVTQLSLIDDGAKDGTRDQASFKKLVAAIDAAKANTNKPEVDPKKAALIRAVIDLAREYDTKMDLQRMAEAQKYIDAVQKLFQGNQQQVVDEEVKKQIEMDKNKPAGAGPTQVAAGRRGNTAVGGAGAAGARGGAAGGGAAGQRGGAGATTPRPQRATPPAQPATPAPTSPPV